MKRLIIFNYIILLLHSFCFSQNKDSLWAVYNNPSQADTNRLKALYDISWTYIYSNPDTAIILSEQQLQLAQKTKQRKYEGIALKTMGVSFLNKDNSQKALKYLLQALKINEELGNKQGIGSCSNNIGAVYQYQSNYTKALEYYLKSLKISEERGDKQWIAACYSNIGLIYANQDDYTKALSFHFRALKIREELGDKQGIGTCYNNIGIIYISKLDYPKALEYQLKALKISEEIDDLQGIGSCYGNIASIYMGQLNYSKALEFNIKSLKIRKEIDDKQGIGVCYNVMAELYNKLLDFKLAIQYSDSSLQMAKEIADIDIERGAYQNLATAYSKTNKYKDAYEAHVKFLTLTDSIFNADNDKQLGDLKTNFEVEKREAELKAIAETQQAISNVEQKRQQFVIYAGSAMFVLVLIFAAFIFNRFKITQKQKRIIEKQKYFVEENQKEIIDSITYAKRLQQAILPSADEVKKYLPASFIYYKPKDIIAGDFYWLEHLDDTTYIAAADSTGHGVPGAIVSVVCSNALNRAVKEFGLRDTGKILDKTRELVLETFQKSGEEIKPDKQSIGQTDNPTPFTTHTLDLQKGDTFYLMTDGYADQFGGDKGKKYKYKQLEMLLINNNTKSLDEQKEVLNKSFENWKGNLGQVDDVTIIGIKM